MTLTLTYVVKVTHLSDLHKVLGVACGLLKGCKQKTDR